MSDRNLRIRMLLEAGDRVTRPMRDMAAGSNRLGQSLKATRDRLKEIDRAQADIAGFRQLKAGVRTTEQALQAAQTRVGQLAREMQAADTPTKKLAADFARAKREAQQLATQHGNESRQLQELRDRLRSAGIATNDLARHERELRVQASATNEELAEQERRLRAADSRARRMAAARDGFSRVQDRASGMAAGGSSAIAIGIATGAPLIGAAKGAMSLEEGMAGVAKVTGMARAQLDGMQDKVIGLTEKIPMTAIELANIAASAGAAGVGMDKFGRPLRTQADDLVQFTDGAARMGIAFDMAAEDAGSTMAKWRQSFKMTQPEVEALGDRVNALTNKFGGKASTVAGIVTRIGPLGEVAGLAAAEISALASSLNSIGVEEEIAATGIKNLMLNMTKGAAASKDQRKAFGSLGLDAEKLAKSMQVNASGTIVDLLDRVSRLSADKQASILSEMFGTESVGAIAPLLTNLDGLKQRLGLVGDSSRYAGSMTAEFLSRINTTTGATDLAANGFQAVNLSLGQALLPTIKAGAQRFAAMAQKVRQWTQANPALAKGVMFLAGGLALLFMLLGVGGIAIAGIMGPIAILNAGLIAMGVSGGLASVGLLPIIGTVAAVVAGVALLAGAAYLLYNNWGAITGFFSSLWAGVTAQFTSASNAVTGIFSGMWEGVKSLFSLSLSDILNGIAYLNGYALGLLFRFGSSVLGWLTGTLPGLLSSGFNTAWAGFTGAISAALTWLTTRLPQMLAQGWNMAWTGFKIAMRAAFVELPKMFAGFGTMIIQGLWNGIKSAPGRLWNAGKAMAKSLSGGFKAAADIHSPSRVFMALGGHVMGGLDLGLARGEGNSVDRMKRHAGNMAAALALSATPAIASAAEVKVRSITPIGAQPPGPGKAPAASPASAPGPGAGARYEPHFHAAPGMDERELFDLWKKWFADHQSEAQARDRSSFTRPDAWEE